MRARPSLPLRERLAMYSRLTETGCAEWTASCDRYGYGQMKWLGTQKSVHRLAWIERNGAIPDGKYVCHRCDNPKCLNVDHLFLGSPAENMADMASKGRGRSVSQPKLSPEQQRQVRADARRAEEIAADFGVSRRTVFRVKRRAQQVTA